MTKPSPSEAQQMDGKAFLWLNCKYWQCVQKKQNKTKIKTNKQTNKKTATKASSFQMTVT